MMVVVKVVDYAFVDGIVTVAADAAAANKQTNKQ